MNYPIRDFVNMEYSVMIIDKSLRTPVISVSLSGIFV